MPRRRLISECSRRCGPISARSLGMPPAATAGWGGRATKPSRKGAQLRQRPSTSSLFCPVRHLPGSVLLAAGDSGGGREPRDMAAFSEEERDAVVFTGRVASSDAHFRAECFWTDAAVPSGAGVPNAGLAHAPPACTPLSSVSTSRTWRSGQRR
jgi:hypothetical protein